MLVDLSISSQPSEAATAGAWAEEAGFAGVWTSETNHDPLLASGLVAAATRRLHIGTAVAIAFARSPMTTAYTAWDLHLLSGGRFTLGLGSQVKPHIERRFSMSWSHPARRMREYVEALRAIWTSWQHDRPLDFRGEFYTHSLMTPHFAPEPSPLALPKIYLAAVGEEMMRAAAAVADGIHIHPLASEKFLREVVHTVLERAEKEEGRDKDRLDIVVPVTVVCGTDKAGTDALAGRARRQIGFYASTPGYRSVLELHGWGDLQPELQKLVRAGRWDELETRIDDEVLNTFAVVGEVDSVAATIRRRYGDLADRITLLDVGTPRELLEQIADAVNEKEAK